MSEGGLFPWRIQKIQYPKNGRPGNYANLSRPLPDPPKDQIWVQDGNTRDWKLVPLVVATTAAIAAEEEESQDDNTATAAAAAACDDTVPNDNHDHGVSTAIPIPLPTVEVAIPINRNTTTNDNNNNSNCNDETSSSYYDSNGNRCHAVQSTDTFQGICLRYKVTPTELRRANKMVLMDLNNLTLYTRLIIPHGSTITSSSHPTNNTKQQQHYQGKDGVDPENAKKITALLSKVSSYYSSSLSSRSNTNVNTSTKLTYSEARAYLEIEDWDLHRAMESVCEDFGWSTSSHSSS